MSKIKTVIKCATTLLAHPSRLDRVLEDEDGWKAHVTQKYGRPNGLSTIDLPLEETIHTYSFLDGTSMLTDLALLKSLARRFEHCSFLEIGTWRGESVANVASVAEECTTMCLSDEEMRKAKYPDENILNHAIFSRKLGNVTHIGHDSRTFDFASLGKKFDLIFIDGDHSYEAIKSDTQNAFRLLKDESSVIIWHDYGFTPSSIRWSVLAGILDGCPAHAQESLHHVSNTMCAVFLRGSFKESYPTTWQLPEKVFTVSLHAEKWPNQ
jgi:predicted O-methyltransferase YrrM